MERNDELVKALKIGLKDLLENKIKELFTPEYFRSGLFFINYYDEEQRIEVQVPEDAEAFYQIESYLTPAGFTVDEEKNLIISYSSLANLIFSPPLEVVNK